MVRTGVGDVVSESKEPSSSIVHEFRLMQNYPNPFNPETMIPFELARSGDAALSVFNVMGQHIATLVEGRQPEGYHIARWNGRDSAGNPASSGIYFVRLESSGQVANMKIFMLR